MRLKLILLGLAVGNVLDGSLPWGRSPLLGAEDSPRPNILWITSEDNGPHLGCYGDRFATTPHLDALAARGTLYLNAWSTAPVCAPARTTIISGMYPPSLGAEHMRSMTRLPSAIKMFPQYLRAAGYYCTNNSKEDYNLEKPGQVWDESGRKAHWKNRRAGQPFFAVFNFTVSHESQIRKRPHAAVHDPANVRVPAYHPDAPEVRQDWAQYYDKVTEMDRLVGNTLRELQEAGLADDTIVFYYGDHGSGMPRSKRWPYNSGLHVPLIVHVPEKFRERVDKAEYQPGGKNDRLVGFIDLAPTVLSLAGVPLPPHFQGHAFLGPQAAPPQPYAYGFRGRMDERYDMVRVVRNQRYLYIRNYMPHKIYGQYIAYMFQTPTTRVWHARFREGTLNQQQQRFWQTKPAEELYDLQTDRDEVRNLASDAASADVLRELRQAHRDWVLRVRDVGFLPEQEIHQRSAPGTPYEFGHSASYPLERILEMAQAASSGREEDVSPLATGLADRESAVRYWAAMGLLIRGPEAVKAHVEALRRALADSSPSVRVIAAEALAKSAPATDREPALKVLVDAADLNRDGFFVAMLALNALDELDERAASVKDAVAALPQESDSVHGRHRSYIPNLVRKLLSDLKN